jgi:hypothetical protein
MAAKNATETAPTKLIELRRLEPMAIDVELVGKTPLIPHKWSQKAIAMMQAKQSQPGVRTKREPKDPEQEAYDSCYWLKDDSGGDVPAMPATAFKAAMVGACRFFDGMTMTVAKQTFYVAGEGPDQLVRFAGDATMRTDTPRNATGVADLRYRFAFFPWSITLHVEFLPQVISPDSVIALLDAAGRGGVGDWRPSAPRSATGTYGQWRVAS